jgi:LacI family gluconate utilization system Gnt-I transcriptional repressor
MNARHQRPRLEEVAALANVSPATVSRYFTRRSLVSDSTAARIKEAVDQLGYLPNLVAGSLATKRSRLVAILVPGLAQSPFNMTIESIANALGQRGYTAMLGVTGPTDQNISAVLDAALGRRVDGVILTGIIADEGIRQKLRTAGVTVIETWGLPDQPIDCAVGFSHAKVGEATAAYIHKRGYLRPLLVTARGTRSTERREGFVDEWAKLNGGPFSEVEVESPSNFSQARAVFRNLRALNSKPDVIICGSDGMAQGLIVEATYAGLSLPDDLAVMGFGNQAVAADMRPSITTIGVDGTRIGLEAANLLHLRSESEQISGAVIDVGFQVIERESA